MNTTNDALRHSPPTALPPPPPSSSTRRGARVPILAASLALAGIVLAVLTWGGPTGTVVDGTTTIRPSNHVDRILLHVEAGTIELVPGEELHLEATRSERSFVMDSDLTDGLLTVDIGCPRFALLRGCQTPVRLVVPPSTAVVARTEAGAITASGLTGGADLRTGAGAIDVHELEGTIRLRSAAGHLRGSVVTGTVEATTTTGAIAIRVVEEVERLDATTEVGTIDLILPVADYQVDASATLGRTDVEIAHTPGAARSVRARSELGSVSIRSEHP